MFDDAKKTNDLAVILCVWGRINYLKEFLDQLKNQKFKNFDLYIINNNHIMSQTVLNIVSDSGLNATVYHNEINLGPMIRFVLAKKLHSIGYEYVVFLDDDEILSPTAIETFYKEREPKTLKAMLALNFGERFKGWAKTVQPRDLSKYVGPGGMVADASIFSYSGFWDEWEPSFYIIDDFWISYYAGKVLGWKCVCSSADIKWSDIGTKIVPTYKKTAVEDLRELFIKQYNWTAYPNKSVYVKWECHPKGKYIDDVGKRYDVSIINEDKYITLPPAIKRTYSKHWSGERFIELSGLREA